VALQIALGATCGYLAWSVLAALVWATPVPDAALPSYEPGVSDERGFEHFTVISERNLFGASSVGAAPPPPPEEQIAESKLRVRLYGTAATDPPEFGVASVEDLVSHERLQLRKGDRIQGAEITRVERNRVIVENKGRLEEILLDEEGVAGPGAAPTRAAPRAARRAPARQDSRARAQRVSERVRSLTQRLAQQNAKAPATAPPQPSAPMASPAASLLRQAQIRPKWDGQELLGLELNRIAVDSDLAAAGLVDGDVLVAVNGRELSQLAQSYELLRTASNAASVVFEVDRGGEALTVEIERQETTQ
jgi:general secretion pathway protein C